MAGIENKSVFFSQIVAESPQGTQAHRHPGEVSYTVGISTPAIISQSTEKSKIAQLGDATIKNNPVMKQPRAFISLVDVVGLGHQLASLTANSGVVVPPLFDAARQAVKISTEEGDPISHYIFATLYSGAEGTGSKSIHQVSAEQKKLAAKFLEIIQDDMGLKLVAIFIDSNLLINFINALAIMNVTKHNIQGMDQTLSHITDRYRVYTSPELRAKEPKKTTAQQAGQGD